MTYITQAEFEKRFGESELAELTESTDFASVAADAASLVDGYLAARYTLPLASVPMIVKGWAADVLRFKLWDEHAPEEVRRRYEDALAQLKLVSTGVIALPPGSDGSPSTSGVTFGGYSAERVFTRDSLAGY